MNLYDSVSYELSQRLTERYSTSFSLSSSLLDSSIRPHIYAIYGMVRVADEIVDTYRGDDAAEELNRFEAEVARAVQVGYSTNPIIQAYAQTARQFGITDELTKPFFDSMRSDLSPTPMDQAAYEAYIYGSAEVVGLMCLRVFVEGDEAQYQELRAGAQALGSAYQKVNFLRDIAADYNELGRSYFPTITHLDQLTDEAKQHIINEVAAEYVTAYDALQNLPKTARRAVRLSYECYTELLNVLQKAPAETIKTTRLSVPKFKKTILYLKVRFL